MFRTSVQSAKVGAKSHAPTPIVGGRFEFTSNGTIHPNTARPAKVGTKKLALHPAAVEQSAYTAIGPTLLIAAKPAKRRLAAAVSRKSAMEQSWRNSWLAAEVQTLKIWVAIGTSAYMSMAGIFLPILTNTQDVLGTNMCGYALISLTVLRRLGRMI